MNIPLSWSLVIVSRIFGNFYLLCFIIKRSANFVIPFLLLACGNFLIVIVAPLRGQSGNLKFGVRAIPYTVIGMPAAHRYGRAVSLFLLRGSLFLSGDYVVFLCFFLRVAGKRKALRVGLRSPIRRVSRILYGGVLRHPPILMNSVDFIDKCLLFIFLKNFLIFFFLCVNISYLLKEF